MWPVGKGELRCESSIQGMSASNLSPEMHALVGVNQLWKHLPRTSTLFKPSLRKKDVVWGKLNEIWIWRLRVSAFIAPGFNSTWSDIMNDLVVQGWLLNF
jgi:hypothetical protein